MQRYIKGQNMPPFDVVARLCLEAGVSMEWLATGEGEMLANVAKPAPHKASQPVRSPDAQLELGLLGMAIRIADDVLRDYGIRDAMTSDEFARVVQLTYDALARGRAEDDADAALRTVLQIARKT